MVGITDALPTRQFTARSKVVAVGWGRLTEDGSLPTTLQQVTLQIIGHGKSSCSQYIHNWYEQLCAGVSGGGKGIYH